MLRFSTLVLLLVLAGIYAVDARPNGAPASACDTLTPSHSSNTAQTTEVPYNIDLTQFSDGNGGLQYVPGQTYTLTLQGSSGESFRGFFVQSRVQADDTTRVGVFAVNEANTRLSLCPVDTDGITHSDSTDKTSVTMQWTAPDVGTGPVRFAYAVVQVFAIFWADERSATLQEGPVPPEPSQTSSMPVETIPVQTQTVPVETIPVQTQTMPVPVQTQTMPVETVPVETIPPMVTLAPTPTQTPAGGGAAALVISTLTLMLSGMEAVLLL